MTAFTSLRPLRRLAAAVAALAIGSAALPAAAADGPVRYAAFLGVSGLAVHLGADKGFFKEEGVDVTFVTAPDPVAGLISGDIDVADLATTTALIAAGRGAPLKIVGGMFRTKGPFYLIARPDIKDIKDLAGKTVGAAAFGSGLDVYVRTILAKNGVDLKSVTFVANGVNQQAYASLQAGQVAATIIHEPFVSLAEKQGTARLLARGWDYLPTFHTGVLVARADFVEKHPDQLKKLLAVYYRSNVYAKAHIDEYTDYFAKNVKVDRDAIVSALKREDVIWENDPNVDIGRLNETQKIQLDLGFQDKIYDPKPFLDLRFIPSAPAKS